MVRAFNLMKCKIQFSKTLALRILVTRSIILLCRAHNTSVQVVHVEVRDGVADPGDPAAAVCGEEGGGEGVRGKEEEKPEAEAGQGGGAGRDRKVQEGEGAAGGSTTCNCIISFFYILGVSGLVNMDNVAMNLRDKMPLH